MGRIRKMMLAAVFAALATASAIAGYEAQRSAGRKPFSMSSKDGYCQVGHLGQGIRYKATGDRVSIRASNDGLDAILIRDKFATVYAARQAGRKYTLEALEATVDGHQWAGVRYELRPNGLVKVRFDYSSDPAYARSSLWATMHLAGLEFRMGLGYADGSFCYL